MNAIKYIISYFITIGFLSVTGYGFYELHNTAKYSVLFVVLLAAYLVNFVMVFYIFIQYRHDSAKLSWVMVMAMIPFIGHLLFSIFGKRYKKRESLANYQKRKTFKYEKPTKTNDGPLERQSQISKRGVYNGNFEFIQSGNSAYEKLFKDIRNAKKFLHLHFYIIKPGEIYDQFKSLLIKKANEGVKIRIIVDDFGRWAMPYYEMRDLRKKGIQVKIFNPVHFPFINSDNGFRTHRKIAIIDGYIAHTGGLNIADEYVSLNKKYGRWVDLQARITGESVRSLSLLFLEDWFQMSGEKLNPRKYLLEKKTGEDKSVLVEDSPEIKNPLMQDSIVSLILSAKKTISLSTPYLIPSSRIFSAIRTASLSGVKVEIYIPGKVDKKMPLLATRYFAREFKKYGVKIMETKNIFIHSKIGVFDSKYAYFGTANLDMRSLYSQFEVINIIEGPSIKDLDKLFAYYKTISKSLSWDNLKTSKAKKNLLRFYVNLFSPVM